MKTSRLGLLRWQFGLVSREVLRHGMEFAILGAIVFLLYWWRYFPWLEAAAPGPRTLAWVGLALPLLLFVPKPLRGQSRLRFAASGLDFSDEYGLCLLSFGLRSLGLLGAIFVAGLPLALPSGPGTFLAWAFYAAVVWGASLGPVFELRVLGRGGRVLAPALGLGTAFGLGLLSACLVLRGTRAPEVLLVSSLPFLALLAWRLLHPGMGAGRARAFAVYAEGLDPRLTARRKSGLSALLSAVRGRGRGLWSYLALVLLLELAAARDIVSWHRLEPSGLGALGPRILAILIGLASLSTQAMVSHFSEAPRLFFRVLPVSFASYARRRILPLAALDLSVLLPLLAVLAWLAPALLLPGLAALVLLGASAALLGECRPARPVAASLVFLAGGCVLAFVSISRPGLAVLLLGASALGLGLVAGRRFYTEEVCE